jgi:hypothetical protein
MVMVDERFVELWRTKKRGERKMDWDPPPTPHSLELFLSYN